MMCKPAVALIPFLFVAGAGCSDRMPVEPRVPLKASLAVSDGAIHETSIPIDITLSGGTCGLTSDVRIIGELDIVFNIVETPSGVVRYTVSESARGTGTGDDGSQYRFSYNFHEGGDVSSFPYEFKDHDVFRLVGQQGAPSINARFVLEATVPEVGDPIVNVKLEKGNPFECDPL